MSEVTDALDVLKSKYEEQKTVDESMKTLASGLAAKVRELAGTIVANNAANTAAKNSLLELAATVESDKQSMADAVAANTVAEDEPTPPTP